MLESSPVQAEAALPAPGDLDPSRNEAESWQGGLLEEETPTDSPDSTSGDPTTIGDSIEPPRPAKRKRGRRLSDEANRRGRPLTPAERKRRQRAQFRDTTQGGDGFSLDRWQEPTDGWTKFNPGRRYRQTSRAAVAKREYDREAAVRRRQDNPDPVGYDPDKADVQRYEGVSRARGGSGHWQEPDKLDPRHRSLAGRSEQLSGDDDGVSEGGFIHKWADDPNDTSYAKAQLRHARGSGVMIDDEETFTVSLNRWYPDWATEKVDAMARLGRRYPWLATEPETIKMLAFKIHGLGKRAIESEFSDDELYVIDNLVEFGKVKVTEAHDRPQVEEWSDWFHRWIPRSLRRYTLALKGGVHGKDHNASAA